MDDPTVRRFKDLSAAIERGYQDGQTDYWLPPHVVTENGQPIGRIRSGDAVIFCCRRGEREIQLTRAFVEPTFDAFPRPKLSPLTFVPLTLYHPSLRHLPVAFTPRCVEQTLGEVIADRGSSQLRLAEEEKFAHITYFLSGGRTTPFPGEKDHSVPSSLDDPTRALDKLKAALVEELRATPILAAMNVATGDIMGHSDSFPTKVACAEAVDGLLSSIIHHGQRRGYWIAITADHGLLEDNGPPDGPVNVSHTTNPVPFTLIGPQGERPDLTGDGILADVAPTLLALLKLPQPQAMSGQTLLRGAAPHAKQVMLVVLDGWGLGTRAHQNPISEANTPCWDGLAAGPIVHLEASGASVGLLPGRKGNSEAGHVNLGAGRIVPQDELRIQKAIDAGTFAENPAFSQALAHARARGGALHLLGMLSEQSSHGSMDYVIQLLQLARRERFSPVYIHLITDGRSTQPGTAPELMRTFDRERKALNVGQVVTLIGRGLALDRGGDYTGKTQQAFRALTEGTGTLIATPR